MVSGRLVAFNAASKEEPLTKWQALMMQLGYKLDQNGAWAVAKSGYIGEKRLWPEVVVVWWSSSQHDWLKGQGIFSW